MLFRRYIFLDGDGDGSGSGSGTGEGSGDGSGTQSSGGSGTQTQQQGGQGSGTPAADQMVPASQLAEVRQEAAKHRTDLRNAQKRIEELEGASKTELEKATEKATKAEERANAAEARARKLQVQVLAAEAGIGDHKARADAASLLDWSSIEDPDNDAQVLKALKDLVKDRPYLLGNVPGGADGGAGAGSSASGDSDMNAAIRRAAGRAA